MRSQFAITALSVCLGLSAIGLQSKAQVFTLPVLPDTQEETCCKPEMFFSQVKWLAAKRDSLNIPMVLSVGDVVNYDNNANWETASAGYEVFDKAGIPYAIAPGNHDTRAVGLWSGSAAPGNVNANVRITDKFNAYFPTSRYKNQRGRWEEGKSDNAYYTFQAGGYNWLVITLEFCARSGPVNWAAALIPQFPNHNVIIVTHYHLNGDGKISQTNAGYGDMSAQQIFDRLKKFPNLCMILSGHVDYSALKVDKGPAGNNIYQILQDYQGKDFSGAYIRLLQIDPAKGTISAKMYSPYYNLTKQDDSQFVINDVKLVPANKKIE
ncbi:metallophosphoesterase [Mucilaginibacter sp. UYCu711]|uniref:metallophosphoesterase n=1 Tax=Mucilaginibacter sp. UYCu711 TaxID=3156339 RepID=UPI003D1B37FC